MKTKPVNINEQKLNFWFISAGIEDVAKLKVRHLYKVT